MKCVLKYTLKMPLRAMSRTPQTGLWLAEILLAESCHEQVSFESGFKKQKGRRISEIGWQRVPDKRCKKAEGTLPKCFGVALWDFEELLTR